MLKYFLPITMLIVLAACSGSAANYDPITIENASTVSRVSILEKHNSSVNAVDWSPDGKQLASADDDHIIYIWDYTDLQSDPDELSAHSMPVTSIAYSPDGTMLASGGRDGLVVLWDVADGQQVGNFSHEDQVLAVAFSPDGKLLASAGRGGAVVLTDPSTLEPVLILDGFPDAVNDLAFSPNGEKLATAGNDNKVQIWDVASGSLDLEMADQRGGATAVAYSPDGNLLAAGAGDARIRVWDTKSGELKTTCSGLIAKITDVGFSTTGETPVLASVSDDKALALWDPITCQRLGPGSTPLEQATTGHAREINALSWRPDGTVIATASYDQNIFLWAATED